MIRLIVLILEIALDFILKHKSDPIDEQLEILERRSKALRDRVRRGTDKDSEHVSRDLREVIKRISLIREKVKNENK